MKIAIDISQIVYETGVSVYTQNLVKNLFAIDTKNEYILFGGSLRKLKYLKKFTQSLKGNFKAKIFPIPPTAANLIFNKLRFPTIESFVGKIDVFHSSDWTQPQSKAFKVTTIHDLAPILFKNETHPKTIDAHTRRLEWVKKEVDRIIVPSNSINKDLMKLNVDKDKVRVIPEAADEIFKPQSEDKIINLRNKYNIKKDYLLCIGVGGRKNTQRVIEAFNKCNTNNNLEIVLIGKNLEFKNQKDTIFTGHVPKAELPIFYSGAQALLYPSLYEGFGLPILEAFVCHCPVVTSNLGSMKEVAGTGAVLVEPKNVDSITDGVLKILKNRNSYISKGAKQAKNFSWQKTAALTLKVYQEGKIE